MFLFKNVSGQNFAAFTYAFVFWLGREEYFLLSNWGRDAGLRWWGGSRWNWRPNLDILLAKQLLSP